MSERDATLAGLVFDDDRANNRTKILRSGVEVARIGPSGGLEAVDGATVGGDQTIEGGLTVNGDLTRTGAFAVTEGLVQVQSSTDFQVADSDTTLGGLLVTEAGHRLGALATGAPTRKVANVSVSATEIRNMAASPKTLVAAVASRAFVFLGAFVKYTGGANAFDDVGAGEDLQVKYTDDSGQALSPALDTTTDINLGATTDDEAWLPPLATVVNPVTNAALVLDQVGAGELAAADNDANGDGTLELIVIYDEWTV